MRWQQGPGPALGPPKSAGPAFPSSASGGRAARAGGGAGAGRTGPCSARASPSWPGAMAAAAGVAEEEEGQATCVRRDPAVQEAVGGAC